MPRILPLAMGVCFLTGSVLAHPGSGIVVDRLGAVYFVDTGSGVWKIDREGRSVRHDATRFHWLSLDRTGGFAGVRLPRALRSDVSIVGSDPTLILGGDFPLAVGADGALYYPQAGRGGRVQMMRLTPSGDRSALATLPEAFEIGPEGRHVRAPWIHGLAAGPDGSLYYTERHAVRRIDARGAVSLVAGEVTVPDCLHPPAVSDARVAPSLRGLDVGPDGTLYVAASACSALLAISTTGELSVVLRASDGWSPMGVSAVGRELYVLEYRYIPTNDPADWLPRVRKVGSDGAVKVIAEIEGR